MLYNLQTYARGSKNPKFSASSAAVNSPSEETVGPALGGRSHILSIRVGEDKSASPSDPENRLKRFLNREKQEGWVKARERHEKLRSLSSIKGIRRCGLTRIPKQDTIVLRAYESGSMGFGGLIRCGCPDCPTCGLKIGMTRAKEYQDYTQKAIRAGYKAYTGIATMQHRSGHSLQESVDLMQLAFRRLKDNWTYRRLSKYCGLEVVRVMETTFGWSNGWHCHYHFIWYVDAGTDPTELENLRKKAFEVFSSVAVENGRARCKEELFKIEEIEDEEALSNYLAKVFMDTAMHSGKKARGRGLSLSELQDKAVSGCSTSKELLHEYEQTMRGRNRRTISRKVRPDMLVEEKRRHVPISFFRYLDYLDLLVPDEEATTLKSTEDIGEAEADLEAVYSRDAVGRDVISIQDEEFYCLNLSGLRLPFLRAIRKVPPESQTQASRFFLDNMMGSFLQTGDITGLNSDLLSILEAYTRVGKEFDEGKAGVQTACLK